MKSMTGFGSGEYVAKDNSIKIVSEISSVNRKQLEIRITLPREIQSLEVAIKKHLQKKLLRGMVNVKINMTISDKLQAQGTKINSAFVKEVYNQAQNMENDLGICSSNRIGIKDILRLHGAFEETALELPLETIEAILFQSLDNATTNIIKMRQTEGDFLANDIKKRLNIINESVIQAENFAEEIPILQKQKLLKKLQDADLKVDLTDERIVREIIIFTERADVAEEITRLKSHFEQFNAYLNNNSDEAIGRSLEFLIQEMNREVTTLGNKVGNSSISPLVITMKTQLEKIREQVQNVE